MNILILGGGGREHALAWKIRQSHRVKNLFIAPGNGGTSLLGSNIALDPNDFQSVGQFARREDIDLIIVGPEEPLVRGISDYFKQDPQLAGIRVFGPGRRGALLEGSKAYAKAFMQRYGIPTAAYREFSSDQLEKGRAFLDTQSPPYVLKADGLAAGKGVLILQDREEAKAELEAMLRGKFGEAGSKVVIEEFLSGLEFSVFALTDGKSYQLLPVAKDYKRIGEGDTGLNTGGMGAVSPVAFVDDILLKKVEERIVQPTVRGLEEEGIDYCGFLFFGLIEVRGEPYVIEYNCRMGDPEAEVVLPRLKTDLVDLIRAAFDGDLKEKKPEFEAHAAATVILVSGGYPGAYEKGKAIEISKTETESLIFHAGTREQGQKLLTNGGRVLAVTSLAETFPEALQKSYSTIPHIRFEGMYYRTDIGFDLG